MAEERIRYRVELDPRQVEGQLSSLRASIGGAINSLGSGLNYTGQVTAGAYNSISTDLSAAQQAFLNRPTLGQVGRTISEAGLEFGTTAASVGVGSIPLIGASMYAFGAAPTVSALATGAGAVGSSALTLAGAGFSAARLGFGVARMAATGLAGAAVSPVGIALAGSYALGRAATSVGERVLSDFRGANAVQDILTARGINQDRASSIAPELIATGHTALNLSAAETTGILEQGMSLGMFDAEANNPEKIAKKLVTVAKRAKTMMRILNSSLGEAMQHMGEMGRMGITGDTTGLQMDILATGSATGLGARAMTRAAGLGAQMARQVGLATGTGAGIGITALAQAQAGLQLANLSPGQIAAIGDVQGLGTAMASAQARLMAGPMARAAAYGVSDLYQFAAGEVGAAEAVTSAARRFAGRGATGYAESIFEMDKRMGSMTEAETRMLQLGIISNAAKVFNIDPGDTSRLALTAGEALGFDVTTPQGRAQAMAAVRGITDPTVQNQRMAELEARRSSIVDQATGVVPTISRLGTAAYESTLGRAANSVSYTMNEAYESTSNAFKRTYKDFGRSVRDKLRLIPGGESIVGSSDTERYVIRPPSAITRSAETSQAVLQTLAKMGGRKPVDIVSQWNSNIAGKYTTEQDRSDNAKIMALYSDSQKTIEDRPADVAQVMSTITADEGFMESLSGMSPDEALYAVQSKFGNNAPPLSVIAAGIKESNIQLGQFTPKSGAGAAAEDAERLAASRLGEIMTPDRPIEANLATRLGTYAANMIMGGNTAQVTALEGARKAARGVIGLAGTSEESRMNAATLAFRVLTSKDGDWIKARRELRMVFPEASKEMLKQIDLIKKDEGQRALVVQHLKDVAEPTMRSAAYAAAIQNGRALETDRVGDQMQALNNVTVSQGGRHRDPRGILGAEFDKGLVDSLGQISASIAEQRRINDAIFKNWGRRFGPSDPAGMRSGPGAQ